jgi:hypothetical protein
MLGRDPDLFGMQGALDARRLRDMLNDVQDENPDELDEERRRRGEVTGSNESFFRGQLERVNPRLLEQLLSKIGGRGAQGRAVEGLFGRR